MMKKIAIILFSLGLVVTGAYGFRKLNYWERSAWIFEFNSMERRFEGRSREAFEGRRGQGPGRELRERPEGESRARPEGEFRERPEEEHRARPEGESRARPEGESRERPEREFRERSEGRADFRPGDRGRGGHGRGDSHGGKNVRLRNVMWFLAVFSAFTVLAVYLDRIWLRIRKVKMRSLR